MTAFSRVLLEIILLQLMVTWILTLIRHVNWVNQKKRKVGWGVDEDQTVANNPMFHFFFCRRLDWDNPNWGSGCWSPLQSSSLHCLVEECGDCIVGRTVEVTDGQVPFSENELHGDVFHVSFPWSLDLCGWYVGCNKCEHSTFGSVCSVYLISPGGESVRVVEMGLLDSAGVNFLHFEELLKFKFLLSHPFCIPMHDAKCLVTGSSVPPLPRPSEEDQSCSQSHWMGPFEAEGPAPSHPGCSQPGRHHNDPKITARPCYRWYGDSPRQVGCVIRFWQLRFLPRVASSRRIAALPSWRVHSTRVCVLRFHRIDGLSFRTCEHHLPDCYDLQQGVSLFRLHNCWELQALLFHLIWRLGLGYLTYS